MTINEALRSAEARLAGVTETPRLDAEILLAHALGLSRAALLARLREACDAAAFAPLLERRAAAEPIAYILGRWEFFSMEFACRAPILVPRPETEHLVETVLAHLAQRPGPLLDLCTGTGCVAVAIAKHAPACAVTATDTNPDALALARENAARHGVPVALRAGDLFDALPRAAPRFAAIAANPPYVPAGEWASLALAITRYEDPRALLAGLDGLDCIRRIVAGAPDRLMAGGLLALEIDDAQAETVAGLYAAAGFDAVECVRDLAGRRRVVRGIRG